MTDARSMKIRLILLVVAGMFGFALVYPHTGTDGATAELEQPNIVVIMVDDMRRSDLPAMPQTTSLLTTNYAEAYATLPLCCPSRATFLTGQYAHNHGVIENGSPESNGVGGVDEFADGSTWATWLNPTYQTVMMGKYLNGYGNGGTAVDYVPPGWDSWAGLTNPSQYRGFNVTIGSSTDGGTSTLVDGVYQTDYLANRAVNQIRQRTAGGPLAMWVSFFAPHAAPTPSKSQHYVPTVREYDGMSRVGLPNTPAVNEADVSDKPGWLASRPRLDDTQKSKIITHRRERRDALRSVDDAVARIVAELKAAGEWDNTVVMFISDNGFMQGEHRIMSGKVVPYMEAVRVPLLIYGPGFSSGVVRDPVGNIDLAPTIADLAGVAPGLVVDGMSLRGGTPTSRPIVIEYLYGDYAKSDMPPYHGVIRDRQVYVQYPDGAEFYDLAADPWQQHNLTAEPGYGIAEEQLRTLARDLLTCAGMSECGGR